MAKTVAINYQVGSPAKRYQSNLRLQLLVTVLPLLFVMGYCSGYIEFRIHEQHVMSSAREHTVANSSPAGALPVLPLTTQAELPMVSASPAAASTTTATANTKTAVPQTASANTSQMLQSSVPNDHGLVNLVSPVTQLLKLK